MQVSISPSEAVCCCCQQQQQQQQQKSSSSVLPTALVLLVCLSTSKHNGAPFSLVSRSLTANQLGASHSQPARHNFALDELSNKWSVLAQQRQLTPSISINSLTASGFICSLSVCLPTPIYLVSSYSLSAFRSSLPPPFPTTTTTAATDDDKMRSVSLCVCVCAVCLVLTAALTSLASCDQHCHCHWLTFYPLRRTHPGKLKPNSDEGTLSGSSARGFALSLIRAGTIKHTQIHRCTVPYRILCKRCTHHHSIAQRGEQHKSAWRIRLSRNNNNTVIILLLTVALFAKQALACTTTTAEG